jgi:thymidylate kinase
MTSVIFSGIDEAGKSTQIAFRKRYVSEAGVQTAVLTFWDDVAELSRFRGLMSHKAFAAERGNGPHAGPRNRRDKKGSCWGLTAASLVWYWADRLTLSPIGKPVAGTGANVVICDRYIPDELAHPPLASQLAPGFARLWLRLTPKPDSALVIDADPAAARARKPEYPLESVRRNRGSGLRLSHILHDMTIHDRTIIEPLSLTVAGVKIKQVAPANLAGSGYHSASTLKCEVRADR